MKLRIKGNTVRVRLSVTEVKQLGEHGYIEENTHLGNQVLSYAVKATDDVDKLSATYINNKITLLLPAALASTWEGSPLVGYDAYMESANGENLYILLEKDYKCLDNTVEDQSDNFENPLAANFKK